MSCLLTPVDVTKIMDTMNKLREALLELATRNADLVRRNNRLTIELSFMPPQVHDKIMQAKNSHSKIYFDQRTDPHYLVPDKPIKFTFERANTSDKRLSLLQRHATHFSIRELLDETRDINQLMINIHEHDHKDQDTFDGDNIADDSGPNPMQSAPEPRKVHESPSGEDATKRSHDCIVHTGHRVHPSKVQKMNNTAAVQETLQKEAEPVEQDDRVGTAWHARYMQRMKDGTPNAYEQLMQSKANLPNQGASTQSDPMNQSSSVGSTYTQADAFPPLENQMSVVHVPSVHMGQPQNPYLPIGREYAQYNINNDEVLPFDEITSDTSWKARKSFGKGKGKGRGRASNKGKGKNNANWDFNYSVRSFQQIKEKAKTMPTGISIIPLFQNSDQPGALLSSHSKTSCNQAWFTHVNPLDLTREASAQAMRSNRLTLEKHTSAQTLDKRLIQVISKTITRLLTPCTW
jgi:hypothetical protein